MPSQNIINHVPFELCVVSIALGTSLCKYELTQKPLQYI